MKKIYIPLLLIGLMGCQEELVENPKSLAVESFYNTPAEVEAAVNAIYVPLHDPSCLGGLYPAQQEAMADYEYGRGSYAVVSDYAGLNSTNITRVDQMWDLFYQSIRNANLVIRNAPNGKSISQADVTRYVAEARFMRAFSYFMMVRNWGGVPLRTESNMQEISLRRNTAEEVCQLIIQDLQHAETNLPDAPSQAGRPSRWAAKTMLADVYLHLEQWADARNKADEVIKSGRYSLVTVGTAEDFLKIFGPDVVTTTEEIFALKFSRQSNLGFNFVMFPHHPGAKLHGAGGYYAHYSDFETNPVIKNWDSDDLRKSYNLYSYNIGLGATTALNRKFRDPAATDINGAANDYPLYRYADLLLIHAEAANRANGSPTPEALESLNMVRRRAYGKNPGQLSSVDYLPAGLDAGTFNELVLTERGFETMFEGKRWLDLKRTGKVKEVIKAVKGKTIADKHLLWPIPNSELNYNTAIDPGKDQNPGY